MTEPETPQAYHGFVEARDAWIQQQADQLQGRTQEAIDAFQQLKELWPILAAYWRSLGWSPGQINRELRFADAPITELAKQWLTENPQHQPWAQHQDQIWEQGDELRAHGFALPQVYAQLGLLAQDLAAQQQPEPPEPENFRDLSPRLQTDIRNGLRNEIRSEVRREIERTTNLDDFRPENQRRLEREAEQRVIRKARRREGRVQL